MDGAADQTLGAQRQMLHDLLNGRISSWLELRMKMDISGTVPTVDFVRGLLSAAGGSMSAFGIVRDCLTHGMFLDQMSDPRTMSMVIASPRWGKEVSLLDAVSGRRPGLVVRFYLMPEAERTKACGRMSCSEYFEEYVRKLSERLASWSAEYRETYHGRVMERYRENLGRTEFLR